MLRLQERTPNDAAWQPAISEVVLTWEKANVFLLLAIHLI